MKRRTLVWFRGKDLRLGDHAPLRAALATGGEVIPLFVLDPYFFAPARASELPHRLQFLLDSLRELQGALAERGSRLVVVEGRSVETVPRLAREWRADRVVAQRWVEPFGRERDRRIRAALAADFDLFEGETLHPPGTLRSAAGRPYAVFAQFARALLRSATFDRPFPAPRKLPPLPADIAVSSLPIPTCEALGLRPNAALQPGGERAAHARLREFLEGAAGDYAADRDRLDLPGTSRLSADLKFGTLSPRQVWCAVSDALGDSRSAHAYRNELLWREFTHSTLWDCPELLREPHRREFAGFPWSRHEGHWEAWASGTTGFPVVDAASRQLLAEGFVHNRARMISASFLTRDLLVDYRRGEAHYLRYLTDGDWAQNNANWQWSAGCWVDAQPYFRVFNPVLQGERFDPQGDYVRRWVPALRRVPARWIHRPWEAPGDALREAGVRLGVDYPRPIVDHARSREHYLRLVRRRLDAAAKK